MSVCRFAPDVDCLGFGTLEIGVCEVSCVGPVDLSKDEKRGRSYPARETQPTKPAAPPPARKEESMAQGVKGTATAGACDRCGKEAKLGRSKHAPGKRLCVCCSVRAYKLSKAGLPLDEAGGKKGPAAKPEKAPRTAPAPAAPKGSAPKVIAPPRPAPAPTATFVPLTARNLADALLQAEEVVLRVTCRTAAAVVAVIRAVEDDEDVMIAVDSGKKQG